VNPNPGWCWDGKLNLMAGFGGLDYAGFLGAIIEAAQARTVNSRRTVARPRAA
jgi:D-alanine-D-alanine ligase